MNKKIIAAAIAASIVAPAAMASDVVVYGKVRQSVDFVDMGTGAATNKTDEIQINDKTSRLGFKGSEDLGNGLKAVFAMEFGIDISGTGTSDDYGSNGPEDANRKEFKGSGSFSARNAFVGLAGDFGTVLVGRHDHPLKISTGRLDYFSDTIADNNNAYTENLADFRADGTVAYISPSFSGLTVAAALVPGENSAADGIADAYSVAGMYSNAGLYLSLAYEEGDKCIDQLGAPNCAPAGNDYEQTRVGAEYAMDAFKVGVVYAQTDVAAGSDTDTWVLSGAYTMGNNVLKAKYFDVDLPAAGKDRDGFAIGAEHNFSKRTNAGLYYVSADVDGTDNKMDGDIFSIQMNHSF
jgi:predicted porin